MAKFVVYEIWTRAVIVEAESEADALSTHDPEPVEGMNLSNWHAVAGDGTPDASVTRAKEGR